MTFFEWIEERERIRQARVAGKPWPWTNDPTLRQYSFTNVMREYDKVSVWIQRNITEPFQDNPYLWQMLAIARQINWPESLNIAASSGGWPYDGITSSGIKAMRKALDAYQATGAKVYTGAYMIHADSDARTSGWWLNKTHYVLGMVVGQLEGKKPDYSSMEAFTRWMTQFESWGGFMAYEVACDLRWSRYLRDAPDIYTWANPGPGAVRGLNRIMEYPVKQKMKISFAVEKMQFLLDTANGRKWGIKWPRKFEMRDIEHSLCEYDKHERVRLGEGRPRSQYHPNLGEPK